jgi:hypothetical protein
MSSGREAWPRLPCRPLRRRVRRRRHNPCRLERADIRPSAPRFAPGAAHSSRKPHSTLPRKKVTIYGFPDGRIEVRHQGLALPYRTFDRITRVDQGAIVENKRLSEALELCRAMQAELSPKLRSRKAPARTSQQRHMFGTGGVELLYLRLE